MTAQTTAAAPAIEFAWEQRDDTLSLSIRNADREQVEVLRLIRGGWRVRLWAEQSEGGPYIADSVEHADRQAAERTAREWWGRGQVTAARVAEDLDAELARLREENARLRAERDAVVAALVRRQNEHGTVVAHAARDFGPEHVTAARNAGIRDGLGVAAWLIAHPEEAAQD